MNSIETHLLTETQLPRRHGRAMTHRLTAPTSTLPALILFIYFFWLKKVKPKKKGKWKPETPIPPPSPPMKKKEKIETTWPRTCPCDVIIPHRWRLLFPTPAIDRSRMAQ